MKIEQIVEGPNSAALHRANANIRVANEKYTGLLTKVEELLVYHKEIAAEEGTSVNGIDLADDLESIIHAEAEEKAKRKLRI